jgi:phosphate transport system permease protein
MSKSRPGPKSSATLSQPEGVYFRFRMFMDKFMRYGVAFGGISIIIAITLIFLYLLIVVFPIFHSAEVNKEADFSLKTASLSSPSTEQISDENILHLAMEEQNEVGLRVTATGKLIFFDTHTGDIKSTHTPDLPENVTVTSFGNADPAQAMIILGLSNGHVLVYRHKYKVTFPNNQRLITPVVEAPLGEAPILIDTQDEALTHVDIQSNEEGITLVAATADKRLLLVSFTKEESLLGDSDTFERVAVDIPYPAEPLTHLLVDKDQRELYLASEGGNVSFFDIQDKTEPKLLQLITLTDSGAEITALESLTGGISILVGTSKGELAQWSLVRNENNQEQLVKFRQFDKHPGAIKKIIPEFSRKGFIAFDETGLTGIYHTTAENTVLRQMLSDAKIKNLAISPRANAMMLFNENSQFSLWHIDNEHPEISWKSLWGKVWYESYPAPDYIWQSSSASNDFEPKFSLVPISFGTLKAAFYAMMIAVPLAIMGAIFTAQFMTPSMRKTVKPSIEIMEALPTVILGFLAGLWLAPFVESNLVGIFLMLIGMPIGVLIAAYSWQRLPEKIRFLVPDGWEGALLIPAIMLIGWVTLSLGPKLELWWFDGDITQYGKYLGPWLDRNLYLVIAALVFTWVFLFVNKSEKLNKLINKVKSELGQSSLSLAISILISIVIGAFLSPIVEKLLFDGNVTAYLKDSSIAFDQRNSIVVGLAMGFAVIPTIFSIAEDALFAVPKHLIQGSLALGATQWQTLTRVVILTASPGIFSAVMIGLGRAVGETMIVLMATGNTPVMDFSIFQGMRTLSANIAVEMPESEVDSTHYRVLFLAALVLFAFTFIFNTLAEIVRQRLRRKYSSL